MLAALFFALSPALADDAAVFTCCDDPVIERVVEAWLDAGEALATGKGHAAALQKLAKAAEGNATADDRDAMKRVASEARALGGQPLASAREGLQPLAQEVVWLALRHESGSLEVVQASCPGQGSWLQRKSKNARNPSGAACGSLR